MGGNSSAPENVPEAPEAGGRVLGTANGSTATSGGSILAAGLYPESRLLTEPLPPYTSLGPGGAVAQPMASEEPQSSELAPTAQGCAMTGAAPQPAENKPEPVVAVQDGAVPCVASQLQESGALVGEDRPLGGIAGTDAAAMDQMDVDEPQMAGAQPTGVSDSEPEITQADAAALPAAGPAEAGPQQPEVIAVDSEDADMAMAPASSNPYATDNETRLVSCLVQRIGLELPQADATECCETLAKIFGNVVQHPSEHKFRSLNKSSVFKKVGGSNSAMNLVLLVGFDDQDGKYALHPLDDLGAVRSALHEVQNALLGLGSSKALRYLHAPRPPAPEETAPAPIRRKATPASAAAAPEQVHSRVAPPAVPEQAPQMAAEGAAPPAKRRAAEIVVRLATPAGRSRIVLSSGATLGDLRERVSAASGVEPRAQRLSLEPGDRQPLSSGPGVKLADLGVQSGACVYLSNAEATITVQISKANEIQPVCDASKLPRLSPLQVAQYWDDGVLGPLSGIGYLEPGRCREGLARLYMQSQGDLSKRSWNSHLLTPWMFDLATHPAIIGAVASVLKTDTVLLYQTIVISRSPGKTGYEETGVGWHADGGGYRSLGPLKDFITAFVALSPCRSENGCLEFTRQNKRNNILMELDEGQFSLHSATVQHRATRNNAPTNRVAVVIRYIGANVNDLIRAEGEEKDYCVLASGKYDGANFNLAPRPRRECSEEGHVVFERMRAVREQRYGDGKNH